jgi:hypothetical protein
MRYQVNGLTDIHTIMVNERKIGGAIEAESIRLRSGEQFDCPVITNIDCSGSSYYSLGFLTAEGKKIIVNVNDISLIVEPVHKKIAELKNRFYKEFKTREKIKYLKRLCEVNQGSNNLPFVKEAKMIIEDIGMDSAKKEMDMNFLNEKKHLFRIA